MTHLQVSHFSLSFAPRDAKGLWEEGTKGRLPSWRSLGSERDVPEEGREEKEKKREKKKTRTKAEPPAGPEQREAETEKVVRKPRVASSETIRVSLDKLVKRQEQFPGPLNLLCRYRLLVLE